MFTLRGVWLDAAGKKTPNSLLMTDSIGQHRSDYHLSVAGVLRQSTGVVSDSFFESGRTASEAVGSVVYDEIQLKRTAQTINYIVGSVGNR